MERIWAYSRCFTLPLPSLPCLSSSLHSALPSLVSVCVCMYVCVYLVAQSRLTLCNSMDCSLPGSSVRGILQTRILEWVPMPSSRGSSQPRDWTQVSCIAGRFFTVWTTRETKNTGVGSLPFLRGNLPSPGINPRSPALQADSLPAELQGSPHLSWVHTNRYCFKWKQFGAKVCTDVRIDVTCGTRKTLADRAPWVSGQSYQKVE